MTKKYRAMKFGKPYKLYIMPSARRKINRRCGIFLAVVSVIYVVCAAAAGFNSVIEKMSVKLLEVNATRIINTAISDSLARDFDYSKLVNILDTDITAFDFNSALSALKVFAYSEEPLNISSFTVKG